MGDSRDWRRSGSHCIPLRRGLNEELQDADALRNFFKPGKYLGYAWVQGGAAVGLYVIGRYFMEPSEGTHTNTVSHLGFDLLRANLVTQALTYGIKVAVRRDRPTGECCAFPSGHASVTFATASVLERHFGYRASWPMFAIAGYVSASRLTDNRHFLSDLWIGVRHGRRLDCSRPPRSKELHPSSCAHARWCRARGLVYLRDSSVISLEDVLLAERVRCN
jgi:hypothetical protein